jgi:hypothetical protein
MGHVHGQIAGSEGVLLPTTEQKASSPSPVRSERHVREPRWGRGLIFGLIRLRSPTFIGVRINAAMQVADVNGIPRTIIQTPENRKVGGSSTLLAPPLSAQMFVWAGLRLIPVNWLFRFAACATLVYRAIGPPSFSRRPSEACEHPWRCWLLRLRRCRGSVAWFAEPQRCLWP